MATKQPCKECGARPKMAGRHRCSVCQLRLAPIGDQVLAAEWRRGLVPEELRRKTVPASLWPAGSRWCSGCQSFRELADVAAGASRCRACQSASTHSAMVAKVYGLEGDAYATMLESQGGKCAICRARPKSKRLAVDHDHKTGAVRGLLCSRCNHELMGAAWDSAAMALALWHYINTPPASGQWRAPERGLVAPGQPHAPVSAPNALDNPFARPSDERPAAPKADGNGHHSSTVLLPTVAGARLLGVFEAEQLWRYLDEQRDAAPF